MKVKITKISCVIISLLIMSSCGPSKNERTHKLLMSAKENIYNNMLDAALTDLEKAVKIDKTNPEIYYLRGNIQMTRRDYNSAMLDFNQAILLNENYAEAYVNRGRLWFYLNEDDKKCADYLKAESLGVKNLYEETKFCN